MLVHYYIRTYTKGNLNITLAILSKKKKKKEKKKKKKKEKKKE